MTEESRLTKEVACLEVRNWNIGISHDPSNSNVLGSGQDSVSISVCEEWGSEDPSVVSRSQACVIRN